MSFYWFSWLWGTARGGVPDMDRSIFPTRSIWIYVQFTLGWDIGNKFSRPTQPQVATPTHAIWLRECQGSPYSWGSHHLPGYTSVLSFGRWIYNPFHCEPSHWCTGSTYSVVNVIISSKSPIWNMFVHNLIISIQPMLSHWWQYDVVLLSRRTYSFI